MRRWYPQVLKHDGTPEQRLGKLLMPAKQKIECFPQRRAGAAAMLTRALVLCAATLSLAGLLGGCGRFRHHQQGEMVYVLPREKFLKDRVAELANTTAKVTNGEPLEVLERSHRFLHVKTANGKTGWIEEATVASQQTEDAFAALAAAHREEPYVATATLSTESRMHLHPGRSGVWLYLLESGDRVKLLKRAIAPRNVAQAEPEAAPESKSGESKPETPAVPMEDWWLVRDMHGRTGWVFSRSMDVDVPDALLRLGQGERFMGVYPLDTVHDENSGMGGGPEVTEYVVAYAPDHSGLMYDFDQVVVYTWNPRKHRYEGAYRDRDIEGFLPLEVTQEMPTAAAAKKNPAPVPVFRYKVLPAGGTITLPTVSESGKHAAGREHAAGAAEDVDGIPQPSALLTKTYRLQGVSVSPVGPVIKPGAEAHPVAEKKNEKKRKR